MHNLNCFSGRLAWAIEQTGRSLRSIAMETGMAPASLEYLVKKPNLKKPSKYSARLAAVVGVRPEWLRARDGEPYEAGGGPVDESDRLSAPPLVAPPPAAPLLATALADDRALTDLCIAAIERFEKDVQRAISPRQAIRMFRLLYGVFYDRRSAANVEMLVQQLHLLRETIPPT